MYLGLGSAFDSEVAVEVMLIKDDVRLGASVHVVPGKNNILEVKSIAWYM